MLIYLFKFIFNILNLIYFNLIFKMKNEEDINQRNLSALAENKEKITLNESGPLLEISDIPDLPTIGKSKAYNYINHNPKYLKGPQCNFN